MARSADVAGTFFVRERGGIREYKLGSNDLQILLVPDSSVPVAGCNITYRVGSRNEAVGYTGSTHLLEHLMFKGSENYNKEKGTTIWSELEKRGAHMNATTWLDRTNYYETLPKEHLEVALSIEADRMRKALFKEGDRASEMTVVRNEFERGENKPIEALDKLIWSMMFLAHPYHHSTIGWRSDIETVTIERLRQFYDDFYWPNNATLVVAGDVDEKEVLQKIAEIFGPIGRSPNPIPTMRTTEPPQEGERRGTVARGDSVNVVGVGYRMPEARHPDMAALIVASLVLGGGNTSRFYKTLVDRALATSVDLQVFPFYDPSPFLTYVTLTARATHADIERRIKAEYARLAKTPPTAAEMQVAKRLYRSILASRRDGPDALMAALNEDIARGDWELFFSLPEAIEKVTPRDVSRVVRDYLTDESKATVGYFIGASAKPEVKIRKRKKHAKRPTFRIPRAKKAAKRSNRT